MSHKRISASMLFSNKKIQRVLIAILTFLMLLIICSRGIIPEKYNIKEGDVAAFDIKAPRDFEDDLETQANIEKAISSVQPQYIPNSEIRPEAINTINQYFSNALEIKKSNIDENTKWEKLQEQVKIDKLTKDDYIATLKLSEAEMKYMSEFLTSSLDKILSKEIKNEDDIKAAQNDDLMFDIRNDTTLTKNMKDLAQNIGIALIKPNMMYDSERTEAYKNEVRRDVERVIIKKNQNIVIKGEKITQKQIYLMQKAGLLKDNSNVDLIIYAGVASLIAIMETLIIMYIFKFRKNIYNNNGRLLIISIILCINAVFAAGSNIISGYLIPAGFLVILISIIFDPLMAFMVSIPSAVIVACTTNFNFEVVLVYLTGSLAGILFSYNVHQRNNVFLSGLILGIIDGIIIFSVGLINNNDLIPNLVNSSIGAAGGVLSAILAIGILPVFEQMFDIITPIKLLELSNPNQPLLKKMLFEAPGTYHHSILVGNLAEAAANEVGANALLTRTGAYYHDIGKIKRPYFFKENQITNDNPHDKITPKLSTLIITSHVKDGMELAEEYKLPRAIKDIIEQHHGTTLVRYFYVMAMNNENEMVEEASFRYDGPKPFSKEAAIVMLADSVEAAVRSMGNPTTLDMEKMVNKIVEEKVDDGQLDNCDLTLKDIEKIKQSFLKILEGIFHSRIEYPEVNTQIKEGMSASDRV